MIRPSRYDTPHSDDTDVMVKIANGVVVLIGCLVLVLACRWFWRTFVGGM